MAVKEPQYYSFSQISTFVSCPYRYKLYRTLPYGKKLATRPVFQGVLIHRLLELYFKGMLKLSDSLTDVIYDEWNKKIKEYIPTKDFLAEKLSIIHDVAMLFNSTRVLMEKLVEGCHFISEDDFLIEWEGIKVKGSADFVIFKPSGMLIIDFKNSDKVYDKFDQLILYAKMLSIKHCAPVDDLWFFTMKNKNFSKFNLSQNLTVFNETLARSRAAVELIKNCISTDIFPPSRHIMNCKFCLFRDDCIYKETNPADIIPHSGIISWGHN